MLLKNHAIKNQEQIEKLQIFDLNCFLGKRFFDDGSF